MGDYQRKTRGKARAVQDTEENADKDNTNAGRQETIRSILQHRLGMAMGGISDKSSTTGMASAVNTSATRSIALMNSSISGPSKTGRRTNIPEAINTVTPRRNREGNELDGGEEITSQITAESASRLTAAETWQFVEAAGKWDDESIKLTLSTYVKQKMFPHLKFIQGKSMIAYSNDTKSVCGQILARLNVPASMGPKFWERYSRKVECYLNSKRNDTATALKNAFFSKLNGKRTGIYQMEVKTNINISHLTDYLNTFKETNFISNNEEVAERIPLLQMVVEDWFDVTDCSMFCDHFIRAVVGHRKFDQDKRNCLLSTFVTVSDEAYALLVCENNLEKWIDMYKRRDKKSSSVAPKYTNGGKSNNLNASSRRNKGWSVSGTKRYVELYRFVTAQRKQKDRQLAEQAYMNAKIDEYETERPSRKRKHDQEEEDEIEIPHSLWDDMEVDENSAHKDEAGCGTIEENQMGGSSQDAITQRLQEAHTAARQRRGRVYQA